MRVDDERGWGRPQHVQVLWDDHHEAEQSTVQDGRQEVAGEGPKGRRDDQVIEPAGSPWKAPQPTVQCRERPWSTSPATALTLARLPFTRGWRRKLRNASG